MDAAKPLILKTSAIHQAAVTLLALGLVSTLAQAQTPMTEPVITAQAVQTAPAMPLPAGSAPTNVAPPVVTLPAPSAEMARVVSVTPVVQQAVSPQTTCNTETVSPGPTSGAGAVVGALAGAALGSAVGGGSGNALATAAGFVGGAALGNQVEAQGSTQVMRRCVTRNTITNVTVYNVVFEYAGKQYTTQMSRDPGPMVQVQISPVGNSMPQPHIASSSEITQTVVTTAEPVVRVYDPYYYPRYYPNVVFSVGVPVYRGYRHWR